MVEVCDSDYELDMDSSSDGDMPSLLPSRENSDDDSDDDMQNEIAQLVFDKGVMRPNSKWAGYKKKKRQAAKAQQEQAGSIGRLFRAQSSSSTVTTSAIADPKPRAGFVGPQFHAGS